MVDEDAIDTDSISIVVFHSIVFSKPLLFLKMLFHLCSFIKRYGHLTTATIPGNV